MADQATVAGGEEPDPPKSELNGDGSPGGPTAAHWATVIFIVGHFVVLLVFVVLSVAAIIEIAMAGGWTQLNIRGSRFVGFSTWLLLLFGVYPLPALAFWRPFLRASVSWLDILRRRQSPQCEADKDRGWLFSPWGPWILIVNCVVPIAVAIWGLVWLEG